MNWKTVSASCRATSFGALLFITSGSLFGSDPGTVGIAVNQLYSDQQATRRGALIVRHVDPGSAAEEAGIKAGDLILATDGTPVFNSQMDDLVKRLAGPAGTAVELTVVQADGTLKKFTVTRRPYPPHINPAADRFSYSVPGNWQKDLRYPFPLPWSPALAFEGFEDLYFAPGFDNLDSPEYHSYVFLWWLDNPPRPLTAPQLESAMVIYFKGLAEQRGHNNNFKPDLSQIQAHYSSAGGPSSFGGAAATNFAGIVTIYDRHGKVLSLYSEVSSSYSDHGPMAVFFAMSKEPRPSALWPQMDAIRDGFRYRQ